MQTIVLATQKGGSGKSTLAIGLAVAAIQAGHTVRLIETDPQGTLSNWQRRRARAEPIVEPIYSAGEIEQRLQSLDASGRDDDHRRHRRRRQRRNDGSHSLRRFVPDPARPSIADIEATVSTLDLIRAWKKPFAFVLNQTPIRGQRINTAATTLGDEAALDLADVLAQPFVVMRNDHQDALNAGLAVNEYASGSKSADEIRGLWQWSRRS